MVLVVHGSHFRAIFEPIFGSFLSIVWQKNDYKMKQENENKMRLRQYW